MYTLDDRSKFEVATDYTKRTHVFRLLPGGDEVELLCQATSNAEMVEWIAQLQSAVSKGGRP